MWTKCSSYCTISATYGHKEPKYILKFIIAKSTSPIYKFRFMQNKTAIHPRLKSRELRRELVTTKCPQHAAALCMRRCRASVATSLREGGEMAESLDDFHWRRHLTLSPGALPASILIPSTSHILPLAPHLTLYFYIRLTMLARCCI